MDLGLSGKRVLVVGASQGLGAASARAFLAEGAHVIGAARRPERIAALGDAGAGRLEAIALDLADRGSIDALADRLLADGGVDVLVNNCGGPAPGGVLGQPADRWISAFESMAASMFHLTDRLIQPMLERRWGRIVTIGSSGIVQPIGNLALSNGVRGAIAGWSKSLANEVAGHGVTVNMVLPGRIDTERVQSLDQNRAQREQISADEAKTRAIGEIPTGRYGQPEEFAAMVVFLAGVPAAYVTGSMIRVDGGLVRGL